MRFLTTLVLVTIALACRDPFGKRLAAGLTVLVCAQAAVNIAAVMAVAPLTGIPLPFVSYGGSSLVVLLVCLGVVAVEVCGSGKRRRKRRRRRKRCVLVITPL